MNQYSGNDGGNFKNQFIMDGQTISKDNHNIYIQSCKLLFDLSMYAI